MKSPLNTFFWVLGIAAMVYVIYATYQMQQALAKKKRNQPLQAARMIQGITSIIHTAHTGGVGITEKEVIHMKRLERQLNEMGWQYRDDLDQWVNGCHFIPANLKEVNKSFESLQGGSSLTDFLMGFHYPAYAN